MRETHDYGEIEHGLILEIFGDELTFNELKFYARDKSATSYLTIEYIKPNAPEYIRIDDQKDNLYKYQHTQLITAFIYGRKLLEKKYCINHSCEMFNILSNMKPINEQEYSDTDDEEPSDDETSDEQDDDQAEEETDDDADGDDNQAEEETSDEQDGDDNQAEEETDDDQDGDDNQAEKDDPTGIALFYYYASLGKSKIKI